MDLVHIPVRIRAENGHTGGEGSIEVAQPPLGRRIKKAALRFLIGLGVGLLLLPIPLIHLAGLAFFVTMTVLAVRRLLARRVLKAASGRCPSCNTEGTFFVGLGGRGLKYPISTSCPHCNVVLALMPQAPDPS